MLRSVALVRTEVSEERSASIIRVTRIGELRTSAVTNNPCTVRNVDSYKRQTELISQKTQFFNVRKALCLGEIKSRLLIQKTISSVYSFPRIHLFRAFNINKHK
jgi:hypothetical protein